MNYDIKSPVKSIPGQTFKVILALASNATHGLRVGVVFFPRYPNTAACSCGFSQGAVVLARNGSFATTRTDVDSSLVHRVPVASTRGVFRQWQVGLGLIDLSLLVGVLVDDGLKFIISICHGYNRQGGKSPSWRRR